MINRNIFENINPFDHRYSYKKEVFDEIKNYLSESANINYQLKVELALVKSLNKMGICSQQVVEEVSQAVKDIKAAEAYEEERKTKHNIRALVNLIQEKVSDEAKPFIHLTATSYDIVDTANSLRYKEVTEDIILPQLAN